MLAVVASDTEEAVLKHLRWIPLAWRAADVMMVQNAMMPHCGRIDEIVDDRLVGSGVARQQLAMQHPMLRLSAACGEATRISEHGANLCSEGAGA